MKTTLTTSVRTGIRIALATFFAIVQITISASAESESTPLANALKSKNTLIQRVVQYADQHELQILLTVFKNDGSKEVARYQYRLDSNHYFYPASTVKLPMALLAAEFVSTQPAIELETPYSLGDGSETFTIKEDIRLIFAISDDHAYNRLYEIIGRDYANKRLAQLNYRGSRIAHRLAVQNADAPKRQRVTFFTGDETLAFKGSDSAITPMKLDGKQKGKAFIKDGNLISEPFDFSLKNRFPLEEQHQLLQDLFISNDAGFKLDKKEREFLLNATRLTPAAAGITESKYYDGYAKFFMYGDTKNAIPDHVKIYNKVGYAYGTLTDNAYIKDEKNNFSFLLTATLLVNENQIFNDDKYEYDSVGIPFLAQLGREIHALLLKQFTDKTNY